MRTISEEELEKILENHRLWNKRWVKGETDESDGMRANLTGMDLSRMDLRGTDLRYAKLDAANLIEADLRGADLSGASLIEADLQGANLVETNFCIANLYRANLSEADLFATNLSEANLHEAELPNPEIMNSICPLTCPETGAFIGWKKAYVILPDESGFLNRVNAIVELQIPARAKRSSATGRKCRCNKALVLDIQTLDGESLPKGIVAHSYFYPEFTYKVGQKLYIKDFDDNRWNECSTGIHFFITRQEAVDY